MTKHDKKEKVNIKVLILSTIRLICFVTLIISISYIINWYIDYKQNSIIEDKLSKSIHIENIQDIENKDITETKYNVDFKSLKEINNDTVGWIKVNGTNVENTVVQYKDNDFYIKHNFEKNTIKQGGYLRIIEIN